MARREKSDNFWHIVLKISTIPCVVDGLDDRSVNIIRSDDDLFVFDLANSPTGHRTIKPSKSRVPAPRKYKSHQLID